MISPGTWPHYIRCSRASGNSSTDGGGSSGGGGGGGGTGVLTCGYSCTALRNYFKLWRTAERERDWEVWHVSRWQTAPPAERRIRERKKEETLMLFPSYARSSILVLLLFLLRGTLPRYTLVVLYRFLLSSLKFLIPALLPFSSSLHLWPRCLFLFLSTPELRFLFFASWSFISYPRFYSFFFLILYSCLLPLHFHICFVSLFQFLPF